MLQKVKKDMIGRGHFYANWARLQTLLINDPVEVAIVGERCMEMRRQLDKHFLPRVIISGGLHEGRLPLLKDKLVSGFTMIYVCKNRTCQSPVSKIEEALAQLKV
jgi:uncharacterized protein YyaL (SSP411 family)